MEHRASFHVFVLVVALPVGAVARFSFTTASASEPTSSRSLRLN